MKGAPREYQILPCNDRLVIFAAAVRRVLFETLQLGNRTSANPAGYSDRSFKALIAYVNAGAGAYLAHTPNKIQDLFQSYVSRSIDAVSLHELGQKALKAGIDQVGSARLGVGIACVIIRHEIQDRAEELDSAAFEAGGDLGEALESEIEEQGWLGLDEVLGLVAQRIGDVDDYLRSAVDRFLADQHPRLAGRSVEVIAHDLTSPILVITPEATGPLITSEQIGAQLPALVMEVAFDRFEDLTELAVDELLEVDPLSR